MKKSIIILLTGIVMTGYYPKTDSHRGSWACGWRPAEYIPLGWGSYDMGAFTEEGCPNEALKIMLTSKQ